MIRCDIWGCDQPAVTCCIHVAPPDGQNKLHGHYYACADHAAINEHATDVWEVKP